MDYLLDTNIIIIYGRSDDIATKIEEKYKFLSSNNRLYISIVTLGEIDAFIKKFDIGDRRKDLIQDVLNGVNKIALNYHELISAYGDIDSYSQGKLKESKVRFSSRNMGKNDLWIAATAHVFDLKLVTVDKDFDHLDDYIDLEYIDIDSLK